MFEQIALVFETFTWGLIVVLCAAYCYDKITRG